MTAYTVRIELRNGMTESFTHTAPDLDAAFNDVWKGLQKANGGFFTFHDFGYIAAIREDQIISVLVEKGVV
jgi:hypothetical protein